MFLILIIQSTSEPLLDSNSPLKQSFEVIIVKLHNFNPSRYEVLDTPGWTSSSKVITESKNQNTTNDTTGNSSGTSNNLDEADVDTRTNSPGLSSYPPSNLPVDVRTQNYGQKHKENITHINAVGTAAWEGEDGLSCS